MVSTDRWPTWRRGVLIVGVLLLVLALPWALRGYGRWWEYAMGWKCGTTVEIVLPRAK